MWLEILTKLRFNKKGAAPGKSVLLKTKSGASQEREIELYHPPGISSAPTPEDRVVTIPVGSGVRVAVATHNYRIEVEPEAGETIIYSTNADGSTKQAEVKLTPSGDIELNGNSKTFVTHAELDTALQTFVTALNAEFATINAGAAAAIAASGLWLTPLATGANSIDISASETTTIKTGG